ncbi:hypothetical protein AB6A40_002202 [Gnathostoma spinigerum]|uniref:Uncharacterized protein n=1 Tax=Gnathostoma spinigerum TaxID=75299 RepID=A0ABD6EF30_9BILA
MSLLGSASSFDPYSWKNFFFRVNREEANRLLSSSSVGLGTFLIRESTSPGSYALSVREDMKGDQQVRHYLIEPIESDDGKLSVKIAEQQFVDIPALLNYFKMRNLANVSLVRPLAKPTLEKMVCLYTFNGEEPEDLPFKKDEILEIIGKPQDEWWEARNALGNTGLVPATYLIRYEDWLTHRNSPDSSSLSSENRLSSTSATSENNDILCASASSPSTFNIQTPCMARVILDRRPNVYDTEALRIKKGEVIKVTNIYPSGICDGVLNGKKGTFPFTYVEFLLDNTLDPPHML